MLCTPCPPSEHAARSYGNSCSCEGGKVYSCFFLQAIDKGRLWLGRATTLAVTLRAEINHNSLHLPHFEMQSHSHSFMNSCGV